jgi:hypothetical protein
MRRFLRRLSIGLLGLCLMLLVLWAVVVVPPLLIDVHQIKDPAKRLDEVNGLRTTLAGVLGGLAVVAGALVGALTLTHNRRVLEETQRQNSAIQKQNQDLLELQRRGQITEHFTRAIEQLGDDKLDIRIGAVYALEQIARDSADLHWPIMEVLTAYLREHASVRRPARDLVSDQMALGLSPPPAPMARLSADHQAAATVIGRRSLAQDPDGQRLDLHQTDLPRVHWSRAHLERAFLDGANLKGAYLSGACLEGAVINSASMNGAYLRGAHLDAADLGGAALYWAHMEGAFLEGANLERADLRGANLDQANLWGANLSGASLEGADLRGATGLSWEQLEIAIDGDRAHLPPDLATRLTQAPGSPSSTSSDSATEASAGEDP